MLKRRLAAFWGLGSGESDPLPLRGISCNRCFVILDYAPIRVRIQKWYWKLFIIRLASECPSSRAFPLDFTSLDSHRPEHDLTAPKTKITLLNITSDFISSTSALPARASLAPSLLISGCEHHRCMRRWSLLCLALGCSLLTPAAHLASTDTSAPPDSHAHTLTQSLAITRNSALSLASDTLYTNRLGAICSASSKQSGRQIHYCTARVREKDSGPSIASHQTTTRAITHHKHEHCPRIHIMSSPLFDTFSPEIRAIIYGHVFGPSGAITPTTRLKRKLSHPEEFCDYSVLQLRAEDFSRLERPIETKILTANKQIYLEAIQVLYSTRIVRGSVSRIQDLFASQNAGFLTYAKRVEITRCDERYHVEKILPTLRKLQDLPRIRSVVILSHCLTEVGVANRSTAHLPMTVSKFAQDAMLGPITCIDVGVYQLQDRLEKIRIVNRKLVELWPEVRDAPPDYDGVEDAMMEIHHLDSSEMAYNVPAWAAQTSFRCWVAL
jgi:hypothetical protein